METGPDPKPRSYINRRRADRLLAADGALKALDTHPVVVARMGPRGYKPPKVAEGRALYDAALATRGAQAGSKGVRLTATAAQTAALAAAEALYRPLAASAHAVFADRRDVLAALGLTGRHSGSYGSRLDRMRLFVQEARIPERLAEFTAVGDGPEKFDKLAAKLAEAAAGVHAQDDAQAGSEVATPKAAGAMSALDRWMITMHRHARVAFADEPQYLELLGILPKR